MTPGRNEELIIEKSDRPSGVHLIRLSGPLTLRTLFDFQEAARLDHEHPIIVDVGSVPYMDSAGLGALIGTYASCQRSERKFAIANVPDRVKVLFEMTGVVGLIPIFGSVDEAEASVTG